VSVLIIMVQWMNDSASSSELLIAVKNLKDAFNNVVAVILKDDAGRTSGLSGLHYIVDSQIAEKEINQLGLRFPTLGAIIRSSSEHCRKGFVLKRGEGLDDKAVYAFYLLCNAGFCPHGDPLHDELWQACYFLRNRRDVDDVVLAEGSGCVGRQLSILEKFRIDAVDRDDGPSFCIGFDIVGGHITKTLVLGLVKRHKWRILECIIRNKMRANSGIDPGKLLLTVLQLLSGEEALPVVMAVEETFPWTIRTAMDKSGRNALWYALRYHKRWPGITECSSSRAEEIDQ